MFTKINTIYYFSGKVEGDAKKKQGKRTLEKISRPKEGNRGCKKVEKLQTETYFGEKNRVKSIATSPNKCSSGVITCTDTKRAYNYTHIKNYFDIYN